MVIKAADLDELPAFYKCFSVLMQEGFSGYSSLLKRHFLEQEYSLEKYQKWFIQQYRKIYIAKDKDNVIGFVVGDYVYGGVGFISWLGVLPEYRHQDIGSNLLELYEEFAVERGAHLLELCTYRKVVPFYLKNGFKEIGIRQSGYFGQKNVIMNKQVGNWKDDILLNYPNV